MLLTNEQMNELEVLLGKLGIKCTDIELEAAALAIARFVYAKEVSQGHTLSNLIEE